jgi:hypothetical protein
MAVKEYAGRKNYKEDGTPVDGTSEIQKCISMPVGIQTNMYNPDNNGDGKPDGSSRNTLGENS